MFRRIMPPNRLVAHYIEMVYCGHFLGIEATRSFLSTQAILKKELC